MNLDVSNKDFCLFLLTQFPFAANDEQEIMLSDYIPEHFQMPSDAWWEELTGTTAEPWNGYTYQQSLNKDVTFYAEFHPEETIYFFNDTYLGNTGGHFHLSLLSWKELTTIVSNAGNNASLFFLLLPLTIGNASERANIAHTISQRLLQTSLQPDKERLVAITQFLTRHVIFDEEEQNIFAYKEKIGLTTIRNHSERNAQHSNESLIAINELIRLATL
ncbi:Imm19 family immunity protein [Chitinophaga arvensicola]|uniref:Immunity protein 19 n=1 Tax=Chitinophaga arvensicola TaxID=29529 RepID=A0A1I0RT68_9BACT|nr:Imm19 family immunity protein [Chitinophaga arvensicola]SEW44575.1 Immunity protein 19 [Chitinophaga arvensicola]